MVCLRNESGPLGGMRTTAASAVPAASGAPMTIDAPAAEAASEPTLLASPPLPPFSGFAATLPPPAAPLPEPVVVFEWVADCDGPPPSSLEQAAPARTVAQSIAQHAALCRISHVFTYTSAGPPERVGITPCEC